MRRRVDKELRTCLLFWEKFENLGDDGKCWIWAGATVGTYGQHKSPGTVWLAHRFSWFLVNGPIPHGKQINHSCDVRLCCNPGHLHLGTPQTNIAEAISRKRMANGERIGNSILTANEVLEIRRQYSGGGQSQSQIARKYGVTQVNVSAIIRRVTWKHI